MDFKAMIESPAQYYGDLTVDDTPGGVGFNTSHLVWNGMPPKLVRCALEGGDIRAKEVGTPTAMSGELLSEGDEFFVPGPAAHSFRAIRTGTEDGVIRYHVYF